MNLRRSLAFIRNATEPVFGLPMVCRSRSIVSSRRGAASVAATNRLDLFRRENNGKQARLYTVVVEYRAEAGSDDRLQATAEQAGGGGCLGAADAEVPSGKQDGRVPVWRLIQYEIGILAAILQEAVKGEGMLRAFAGQPARMPPGEWLWGRASVWPCPCAPASGGAI